MKLKGMDGGGMQQVNSAASIYELLGYSGAPLLVDLKSAPPEGYPRHLWEHIGRKLRADSVFFGSDRANRVFPLVYFCSLKSLDHKELSRIHLAAWNLSEAPLLVVVLPGQIRVYSAFMPGDDKGEWNPERALVDAIDLSTDVAALEPRLRQFRLAQVASGEIWRSLRDKFDPQRKVDQMLLRNLKEIRLALHRMGLGFEVIHGLLGRAILVSYLEQRKDAQGEGVFPRRFFLEFKANATQFVDLLDDLDATYALFRFLVHKFNGDVFPVTPDEIAEVRTEHLTLLREFLRGDEEISSGQRSLWPFYSFDVIPIQMLSSIYETFLGDLPAEKQSPGTHYTPPLIVQLLMDLVFPWDGAPVTPRILDPSCGSGAFLAEGYRRIVERHLVSMESPITPIFLKQTLERCIYGVDVRADSIRVAALSLYLTLCDYLEPRSIWSSVQFPKLSGRNLITSDYFDLEDELGFDIVVGNPPWEESLTPAAIKYLEEEARPVGGLQVAQAFMWKSVDDCVEDGQVCLLVPSKGFLFNASDQNRQFRKEFLSEVTLDGVINFSKMRFGLFKAAIAPATAVSFRKGKSSDTHSVIYCSPTPTFTVQDELRVPIAELDVARIPQNVLFREDYLWKVAMWGSPRDFSFVRRLRDMETLQSLASRRGWTSAVGFTVGSNGKNYRRDWIGVPLLKEDEFQDFWVSPELLSTNTQERFHRDCSRNEVIFDGPRLLIKRSPRVRLGIQAAVATSRALFSKNTIGIRGAETDLGIFGAICLILCSDLATYYLMLTGRSYLVERDILEKSEVMSLPLPPGIDDRLISHDVLRSMASDPESARRTANACVRDWYELSDDELLLIHDMLAVQLDLHERGKNSKAMCVASLDDLTKYAQVLESVLEESFGTPFAVKGLKTASTIAVSVEPAEVRSITVSQTRLEDLHQPNPASHSRIYSGKTITIVKPGLHNFWSGSRAMQDADSIYAEILMSGRES